jgi:hypothetical protein
LLSSTYYRPALLGVVLFKLNNSHKIMHYNQPLFCTLIPRNEFNLMIYDNPIKIGLEISVVWLKIGLYESVTEKR